MNQWCVADIYMTHITMSWLTTLTTGLSKDSVSSLSSNFQRFPRTLQSASRHESESERFPLEFQNGKADNRSNWKPWETKKNSKICFCQKIISKWINYKVQIHVLQEINHKTRRFFWKIIQHYLMAKTFSSKFKEILRISTVAGISCRQGVPLKQESTQPKRLLFAIIPIYSTYCK